ncbi:endolysin [Rhodothermus phage RM378]|uniref:endolysin n=1 Tax=Rhodothermus phage RM378 TaxID=148943 RepID=UPI00000381DD|nr:endolysin [Rhodothermus phage RM378]
MSKYFLKPTSYASDVYLAPHVPELEYVPKELIKGFDMLLNWISALETNHLFYSAINYLAKDYHVKKHREYVIHFIYPKFNLSEKDYPEKDEDSLIMLPDHPFARHRKEEILKPFKGRYLAFTASGRYQFIRSTWKHLVMNYHTQKITAFSSLNQDYLALCLVREALMRVKATGNKRYMNLWEYFIDYGYIHFDEFMHHKQVVYALSMVWEAFQKFPEGLQSDEFIKEYEKLYR